MSKRRATTIVTFALRVKQPTGLRIDLLEKELTERMFAHKAEYDIDNHTISLKLLKRETTYDNR